MIGERLQRARKALGLSLRDLAAEIGNKVSAQAIGKYERNEMMPGSAALLALSAALRVSPEYLLSTREIELVGVDFRKSPKAGSKAVASLEATVLEQVERYLTLEELLPGAVPHWVPPTEPVFTIDKVDDAETAADALRKKWKLGIEPIPSVVQLLETNGIRVIAPKGLSGDVSGSKAYVRRPDQNDFPIVVTNPEHNGQRQRFTLAHELAHLVLNTEGLSEKYEEKAADRFAGAFLMPREKMVSLLGKHRTHVSIGELVELKSIFKVSLAALAVRCGQVGILSENRAWKLFGYIKKQGWNSKGSDEPGGDIDPELPKNMERLCLRAVMEGAISNAKAAELLGISMRDLDDWLQGVME